MASLSTCHLGLWLGWQILLNLVKLLKHVEDEWGLPLYVGDRDDVGASEIGGFDNGDNVVVCLMRQFIDDSELMTTALGSIKPLPKYIFVLLDSPNLHPFAHVYSNCSYKTLPPSRSSEALMHDSDVSLMRYQC